MSANENHISLTEHRFSRLDRIDWWDRARLDRSRFLVVGAGALGNEILKNLALIGAGYVTVIDKDVVEPSNLTRSILFREKDVGRTKVECAAEMFRQILPGGRITAIHGNLLADMGLAWFYWADIVIGAVDNREARIFINEACARLGRPWIDGGIEVLQGIARGFYPPGSTCYECTMSDRDWDLVNQRRSCSLIARRALDSGGTPTTPTTASIIGGIQVQEAVKCLHKLEWLEGKGFFFDGAFHDSYRTVYPINPSCVHHEPPSSIECFTQVSDDLALRILADKAREKLGGLDAIDFSRELVSDMTCPECARKKSLWQPADSVDESQLQCGDCSAEMVPSYSHGLDAASPYLEKSASALGLPTHDIVWPRLGDKEIGVLIGRVPDPE